MKTFITILFLIAYNSTFAFEGKVVSIADGDTLTVLSSCNQQVIVRLSGIDTPEKYQAFGAKAKQALSTKVFGKMVEVNDHGQDRYQRTLGCIYLGDRWINLEMVADGWAWHYKQYSKDQKLAEAEDNARGALKGLWADPNPVPPWVFRRGRKSGESNATGESKNCRTSGTGYWINVNSGVRHNSKCRFYENTSKGKPCLKDDGKACGICGG